MIRMETTRDVAQRAPVTLQKASPYPVQVTNTMERILVVEDDHAVQKALRRLFEAEGFEIEISADGKSALEAFRRAVPAGRPHRAENSRVFNVFVQNFDERA